MLKESGMGKEAVVLTISKCITLFIGMASAMLLSRFLTLEEYGTYSQILLIITLGVSFFMLGLPNSINYFLARADTEEDRSGFLNTYYSFSSLLCILTGLVLVLCVPLFCNYFKNENIRLLAYVLAVLPWSKVMMSSFANVLIVYQRMTFLTAYNIINAVLLLGAVIAIKLIKLSFSEYMMIYIILESLMAFSVYIIISRLEKPLRISINWPLVRKIMAFSLPLGLASIVGTLSIELDKLMIGYLLNTEAVAIYTNAGKELPFTIVAASITAVLMPRLVRSLKNNETEQAIELWGSTVHLSYMIICFAATACVVFAPQMMIILYSEKYLAGVNVFRIYGLLLLLRVTYFGMILNCLGKTRFILFSSIASLVLNVCMNYIFFLWFGFVGPAVSTFLSIGIVAFYQLVFTSKETNIPLAKVFPWKNLLKLTFVNGIMGASVFGIIYILDLSYTSKDILIACALGIVWLMVYIGIYFKKGKQIWGTLNSH